MLQSLLQKVRHWRYRGAQQQPDYYDARPHAEPYVESRYLPLWESIAARLEHPVALLDIGCGSGQFAHFMLDRGLLRSYTGFDFSPQRVEVAHARCPALRFEVADALKTDLVASVDYDTAIALEFLEHVEPDIEVLARLRPGSRFIGTVPNFSQDSHVRWFDTVGDVERRYARVLSQLHVVARGGWVPGATFYLLDGIRP